MILETLKELMKNQNYCLIMTCDYPLEGFVTGIKDDNVEMYIFSSKNLDEDFLNENAESLDDRIIERVIFPIAHIEYIYPDHYLRIALPDLETKKLLKNQILNQRKTTKKNRKDITKKNNKAQSS
jgi:hypothetical protein